MDLKGGSRETGLGGSENSVFESRCAYGPDVRATLHERAYHDGAGGRDEEADDGGRDDDSRTAREVGRVS